MAGACDLRQQRTSFEVDVTGRAQLRARTKGLAPTSKLCPMLRNCYNYYVSVLRAMVAPLNTGTQYVYIYIYIYI